MYGIPQNLSDYTLKDYLRLVTIVGAYLILRPHLMKISERVQKRKMEEAQAAAEEQEREQEQATITAQENEWRWGKNAKKRVEKQRKKLEAEARRKAELSDLSSDEDVSDLLS
jgi:hypothetical protein